jgi:hypothetical protein
VAYLDDHVPPHSQPADGSAEGGQLVLGHTRT